MATEKDNVEELIKRLNSTLSGVRSGDRSSLDYIALALAKTGDKKVLSVLTTIMYEGGWEQFTKRYPNPELNCYGDYRDHVNKLCKALWALGDPKGIEIAKKRLEHLIAENRKHEVDEWIMTEEKEMLIRMKKGLVYSDELYQEITKISEEEHRKDFERRERDELNKEQKSGCFIATAVYGSDITPEVILLRHFRDRILMQHQLGKWFAATYYVVSPPLAGLIKRTWVLKSVIKWCILLPLLRVLKNRFPAELENDSQEGGNRYLSDVQKQ